MRGWSMTWAGARRVLAIGLSLTVAAALLPASVGPPLAGSAQAAGEDGPVALLAIDAEDGGVGAHGPIDN